MAMGGCNWKSGKLELNTKISYGLIPYANEGYLYGFLETMKECRKWLQYKESLDMKKEFGNCGSF